MNPTGGKRPDDTYTITLDEDQLETILIALRMLQNIVKRGKFKRSRLPPFRKKTFEIETDARTIARIAQRGLDRKSLLVGRELSALIRKLRNARPNVV